MTSEEWDQIGRATWRHLHRVEGKWHCTEVICACVGPERFEVHIGRTLMGTLPDWQSVLDTTPMLIGIYKSTEKS